MTIEVEVKIELNQKEYSGIKNKLLGLKSVVVKNVMYKDTYFDTKNRELYKSERELRIREITGDINATVLTYKHTPLNKTYKFKKEYEVKIDDASNMQKILNFLGYKKDIQLRKKCVNFYFKHKGFNVVVSLVKVYELRKSFIEIEAQAKKSTKKPFDIIKELIKSYGLSNKKIVLDYYTDMVQKSLQ